MPSASAGTFTSHFIDRISAIDAAQWNAVSGTDYPFLRHEFLHALEASGSVSAQRGWQPQHLLVYDHQQLIAVMPLYLKNHSYGEYVFDWRWAEAYQHHGQAYYPKLLCAIPFTPASGTRLAHCCPQPQALFHFVCQQLSARCREQALSGWHLLFPHDAENTAWQQTGVLHRLGCQFHWFNRQYTTFDDFLADFSSRKRKNLRKERQRVQQQGVSLQRLTGDQIDAQHWQQFYRFYQMTYARHSGHGGYLTPDFFRLLHDSPLRDQLLLVMAFQQDRPIAGALNFFSSDTLYGRYWGAIQDVDCLHFEACYYQGIEFCIERGLRRFDPGAQGEHKIQRGFMPVLTHSCHWLADSQFNAAVADFLTEERKHILHYQQQATELLPFHDQYQCGAMQHQNNDSNAK